MTSRNNRLLKDILAPKGYIRGPFGSALKRGEMKQSGIPVYEQSNAINNDRVFRYFIDDKKYEELKRFTIKPGDLVLSCSGTVGEVTLITENDPVGIISQALLILRPNVELVLPEYLLYFFKTKKGHNSILERSSGSVQVNIARREVIENIEISIPSIIEQKRIVKILSDLDGKIKYNKLINQNLEEQINTIFNETMSNITNTSFKDTCLGDECDCVLGGTPDRTKSEYWGGSIPWINSGEVNCFRVLLPSEYITELGLKRSATKLLPAKTTVIAITGATLGQYSLLEIATCANQSVVGVVPNSELPYEFIYPLIACKIKELILSQTGGAQQHINKKNVQDLKFSKPDKEIMDNYCLKVEPLFDCISSKCFENIALSELRDALLQELFQNTIDVSKVKIEE